MNNIKIFLAIGLLSLFYSCRGKPQLSHDIFVDSFSPMYMLVTMYDTIDRKESVSNHKLLITDTAEISRLRTLFAPYRRIAHICGYHY